MKIPNNNIWTQINEGNVVGTLAGSHNISLLTNGQLRASRKVVSVKSSVLDSDFGNVVAIPYFDGEYVFVTDDHVYTSELRGSFADVNGTFAPATFIGSDALVFNGKLVVTINNNVADWDGATTVGYTRYSLTNNVPHPLAIFDSLQYLAVGNGNTVVLLNTSYSAVETLTIPSNYQVTSLRYRNGFMYIGTREKNGGEARIFLWSGATATAEYEVPVGASWVFSMTEYGSSVASVTSSGQLLQVTGNQSMVLANFPVFDVPYVTWRGSGGFATAGKVFNRGMVTVGQNIYISVDGEVDSGFVPEMKSGVWVYNPSNGLYHLASGTEDKLVVDTGVSRSGNVVTTSVAHKLKTGDAVTLSSGGLGLSSDTPYYAIVVSASELKLASNRRNALAEVELTLSGTPSVGTPLVYAPNTHYGAMRGYGGAITKTTPEETPLKLLQSEVIWGCAIELSESETAYIACAFTDQYSVSRFETTRIYSDNISQSWKQLHLFLDGLIHNGERVVIKAKTKEGIEPKELEGVWLNERTITIGSAENNTIATSLILGDEVVMRYGVSAGLTAHITAIDTSSTTASLVLDEDIGIEGEKSVFYCTDYRKQTTVTPDSITKAIATLTSSISAPWVQFAVELHGFSPAVNRMELSNVVHQNVL